MKLNVLSIVMHPLKIMEFPFFHFSWIFPFFTATFYLNWDFSPHQLFLKHFLKTGWVVMNETMPAGRKSQLGIQKNLRHHHFP